MLRTPLIALLICSCIASAIAQDSITKAPAVKPPIAKPVVKYTPPKTTPPVTTTAKVVPQVVKPAAKPPVYTAPAKPDTLAPAVMPNDKSLNGQYQYLLTKIYHYQQPWVAALWKNANDTINVERRKIKAFDAKLSAQKKLIDSLEADAKTKEESLNESNAKVDAVSLAGISVPKSTYNLIMWGLVLVFGITAVVVIARSGSFSREAKYRIGLYNELEEEYKTFKAKANEKEKKLARELQTERNKNDELLGRG